MKGHDYRFSWSSTDVMKKVSEMFEPIIGPSQGRELEGTESS